MPRNDRLFDHLRACTPSQQMLLWTQDLRKAPEDEDFASSPPHKRVELLSAKIRSAAGRSLMNRFRGAHEMPWREILDSVLDTLGLSDEQQAERGKMSDVQIEQLLVSRFDALVKDAYLRLPLEERIAAEQEIESQIEFEGRAARRIILKALSRQWLEELSFGAQEMSNHVTKKAEPSRSQISTLSNLARNINSITYSLSKIDKSAAEVIFWRPEKVTFSVLRLLTLQALLETVLSCYAIPSFNPA